MKNPILFLVIGLVVGFFVGIFISANFQVSLIRTQKPTGKFVETQQATDKIDYIQNFLEIYNIRAKWVKSLGERYVSIEGKLKNKGARTLKRVETTIYLLDKNGNTIFEDKRNPVYASSLYDKPSLKPNYIQNFSHYLENCPSEWAEGKVKIGITDIEFVE